MNDTKGSLNDSKGKDGEYNYGYKNRETWVCALHLDNDQTLHELMRIKARQSSSIDELAKEIEDFIETIEDEVFSDHPPHATLKSMIRDIGSTWRVDYREVAKNYEEDISTE